MKLVQRPHWYRITAQECPLCGRSTVYRERVYGEKPKDLAVVYSYEQIYDWCQG